MSRRRGMSFKKVKALREMYVTHDGGPMDRRTYMNRMKDFTPAQKRCLKCSYFKGFWNHVPVCGAEECCYLIDLIEKEEGGNGNQN